MDHERVFLTIIPGLEELALEELRLKAPDLALKATIHSGGIELEGKLQDIHSIQPYLKIPTRFLWRVLEFKARDLPKVFQKTKRFSWRVCFQNAPERLHCHSERSRLQHTDKIAETIQKAIEDSLKAEAPKKRSLPPGQIQQLYIRVIDDVFTLSRDLTGTPLHYRSEQGEVASGHEASVRRTLAAAMFMQLYPEIKKFEKIRLIDPMMGSGTLLEEALHFFQPSPRHFSADLFIPRSPVMMPTPSVELKCLGIDLEKPRSVHAGIEFLQQDCFEFKNTDDELPVFVMSNPPYGMRLEKQFSVSKLLPFYQKQLKAKAAVIIAPRTWDIQALSQAECLKTRNSGLPVHLWKIKG